MPLTDDGRLYALPLPFEVNGRVASHPIDSRGVATMNAYLAIEDGHAVLVDTGFTAQESQLRKMLDALLPVGTRLTIWSLRIGEFASVCNVRTVVENYNVDALCAAQGNPAVWVDFRPDLAPYGTDVGHGALGELKERVVSAGDQVPVGSAGRMLNAMEAPLRLLPTHWAWDERTRTLFTADAFTHGWRETADGPWTITADDDPTSPEGVWNYYVHSRFWWLPGARTETLRTGIAEVFAKYDVETIAPAFGCIIRGRDAVERHVRLMDELLEAAAAQPSSGLEVGSWSLAGPRS
jgi:glyoxylase-like metal-dependent hydrolase (beta-lactamase superfamily II)